MPGTNDTPRVYIACLACYNEGRLHGVWVDATDADEMDEKRQLLQQACGHTDNDWAIHDHEGFYGLLGEYDAFGTVAELAQALEEHGEPLALYIDHVGRQYALDDIAAAVREFQEAYQGEYKSLEDFAAEWLEQTGALANIPADLLYYFDYEKWAEDRGSEGLWEQDGHVFWSH